MKRFLISFVLIFALLFNVFADNKKAHKELRAEFEKYTQLSRLIEKGFSLDKLDEINDKQEMIDYLESFFIDENGIPFDNHVYIFFDGKRINNKSRMQIDWSDEYGSKDELLNKGYKEDEIFYYPYFNDEWKDGYRVGKKYMRVEDVGRSVVNYSANSKNALLVGLNDFLITNNEDDNIEFYKEISNSKKKYLILDMNYNCGGRDISYLKLIEAINKMKPKEIFILCSKYTGSMGDCATRWMEKATNIKTTIVGTPTWGGYYCGKKSKIIKFDDFEIECYVNDEGSNWKWGWDKYGIPYPTEGIGATPDIYNENPDTSLEIVKHLINDDELVYPDYKNIKVKK